MTQHPDTERWADRITPSLATLRNSRGRVAASAARVVAELSAAAWAEVTGADRLTHLGPPSTWQWATTKHAVCAVAHSPDDVVAWAEEVRADVATRFGDHPVGEWASVPAEDLAKVVRFAEGVVVDDDPGDGVGARPVIVEMSGGDHLAVLELPADQL